MTDDARESRRRRKAELALRTLGEMGNPKKAADKIGITEDTLHRWIKHYCVVNGYDTPVQAAYQIDRDERMSA